ncbi:MFS transporter [Nonomuraea ferruginea]
MRAHLPFRLIRTAAFAAVCVLLAALAHWLSGGSRPPAVDPAGRGGGAVFGLAAALGGKERSPAQVGWLLVAAQLGLHELFGGDGTGYVAAHIHGQGLGEALGMLVAHPDGHAPHRLVAVARRGRALGAAAPPGPPPPAPPARPRASRRPAARARRTGARRAAGPGGPPQRHQARSSTSRLTC